MKEKIKKIGSLIGGDKIVLLIAIVAVFAIFNGMNSNFLSKTNIVNIMIAASLVGLVAIGHTYLIIAGQNDLSSGSIAAFAGVLAVMLTSMGLPFWLALIITLVVSALIGLCNAMMVNYIKIEPFIATLVTQSVVRGFAYILCDGKPQAINDSAFLFIGKLRI